MPVTVLHRWCSWLLAAIRVIACRAVRCAPETSKADDEPHDKPATTRDWRPGVRSAEQPGTDAEILEPGDDVAHECEVISLSHTGNVPATNHDCVCAATAGITPAQAR